MGITRALFLGAGWIFTALGLVGAFLPVLPTTPFLLLAVWCFARSSPRLRDWLVNHPRFGPPIRNWFEHGAISVRAKVASILMMGLSLVVIFFTTHDIRVFYGVALVLCCTGTFVITRPSRPSNLESSS